MGGVSSDLQDNANEQTILLTWFLLKNSHEIHVLYFYKTTFFEFLELIHRDANSHTFYGKFKHFCLISWHSPTFYRNLRHCSTIIGNIGDTCMMQGDVNTLTVNTIRVLSPKKSPTF